MTSSTELNEAFAEMYPTYDDAVTIHAQNEMKKHEMGNRNFNAKLAVLRTQYPFAEIMPFPNDTLNYLLTANTAAVINLPSETKFIRFWGNGEYYVTRNGAAEIPTTDTPQTAELGRGILMSPESGYWYVEGIQQLSVIAPSTLKLTVGCWS